MTSPNSPSAEASFAVNLRDARAARGLTQAQLADAMARAGFKWHAPTVYKVENGERQIQLGEALELARILGLNVADMAREHGVSQGRLEVEEARRALNDVVVDLILQILEYRAACMNLQQILDRPGIEHAFSREEFKELKGIDAHYPRFISESDQMINQLVANWDLPAEEVDRIRAVLELNSRKVAGFRRPPRRPTRDK